MREDSGWHKNLCTGLSPGLWHRNPCRFRSGSTARNRKSLRKRTLRSGSPNVCAGILYGLGTSVELELSLRVLDQLDCSHDCESLGHALRVRELGVGPPRERHAWSARSHLTVGTLDLDRSLSCNQVLPNPALCRAQQFLEECAQSSTTTSSLGRTNLHFP